MNTIIESLYLIAKFIFSLVPVIAEFEENTIYSFLSAVTNLNINAISTISELAIIVRNSTIALLIAFCINKIFFCIVDKITRRA